MHPSELPPLQPGGATSYTCETAPLFADLTNQATVTADIPAGLPVTASATGTVEVLDPVVTITKTPATQQILAGETANFEITVTNVGDVGLTDIFVTDPGSGRQMKIPGVVARHVANMKGQIAALGIQFVPPAGQKAAVVTFLRDLEQAEHSRRLGGISGAISELGLGNLVNSLSGSSPCGTLTLIGEGEDGFIAFQNAQLVGAQVGRVTGTKALARMLSWSDGSFEFHARVDGQLACGSPTPLQEAMQDAARQVDEFQASASPAFDSSVSYCVQEAAAAAVEDLGKVEGAILDLLRVGSPLSRIADVIPESDAEIQHAVGNLLEAGLIASQG